MLQKLADNCPSHFRSSEEVRPLIQEACENNSDIAQYRPLGTSEQGRVIDGVVLGMGHRRVSLISGAHADEPVGPETLRLFVTEGLSQREELAELFAQFRFLIVPHINPDGEARNQTWIKDWPNVESYLSHVQRELPGRDLEFGFPNMRPENTHVANFFMDHAPVHMHMSLHGMGFSDGAMLLIERHWIDRTRKQQHAFASAAQKMGLQLHDHDRNGEKGFIYIGPGFTTTPEGRAMRAYFESLGSRNTAKLFHDSSMEFVRKLGGDPLCLVTELPLFLIGKRSQSQRPGIPQSYLDFKERIPELTMKLNRSEAIADVLQEFEIRPLALDSAMRLQLRVIELGLQVISKTRAF